MASSPDHSLHSAQCLISSGPTHTRGVIHIKHMKNIKHQPMPCRTGSAFQNFHTSFSIDSLWIILTLGYQIDKCKVLMKCLLLFWLPFITCWRFYYPWQQWQCHLSQYFTLFYSSAVRWHGLIEARYFIYYTKTIQSEERQPNLPQRSRCLGEKSLSGGLSINWTLHGHTDTRTVSISINWCHVRGTQYLQKQICDIANFYMRLWKNETDLKECAISGCVTTYLWVSP